MTFDRMSRLAQRTLGFAALGIFSILGAVNNSSTRIHTWPWVFYVHLCLLVPFLLLGLRLISIPAYRFRGSKFLLLLAGGIVLSVILARHFAFSFEVALLLLSGLSWTAWVALEVARWCNERNEVNTIPLPPTIHLALCILCLPLIAAVFWALVDLWIPLHNVHGVWGVIVRCADYRNPHPFGHWNYTGGYVLLILPWLAVLTLHERGWYRVAYSGLLGLSIVVLFWTFSRGAILGLAAMVVTAVAGLIYDKKLPRKKIVGLVIAGALILGCMVASNSRLRAVVFDPKIALHPSEGDVQRLGMLQAGWLLIKHRPWLGYGPGMTPFVYPEVRAKVVGGVETSYQLHNSFLQFWVDHGIIGLLAGVVLGGAALQGGWLYLRNMPVLPRGFRALGLGSMYSIIGYTVMAITDYQLNVPWIVGALGLHLGILLSRTIGPDESQDTPRIHYWEGLTLLGAALSTLFILIPDWQARHAFWQAWWATPEKDQASVVARLKEAADAEPRNPFYRTSLGLQLATVARQTSNPMIAAGASRGARQELERSLALDPLQEPAAAALGWLYLGESPRKAETQFIAALKLLPDRDSLHLGLALSRLTSGNHIDGVHALALECLIDPAFLASPIWSQEEMKEMQPAVTVELFNYYKQVLSDPRTPDWRKPGLHYAAAWSMWWVYGNIPTASDLEGADPAARAFFSAVAQSHKNGQPMNPEGFPLALQDLIAAQQEPARADALLRQTSTNLEESAIRAAVGRITQTPREIGELLRSAPIAGEAILTRPTYRLHYNIMFRNLDGPGYADLAPRDAYAFFSTFVGELLPSKGLVPGPVMRTLDENSGGG